MTDAAHRRADATTRARSRWFGCALLLLGLWLPVLGLSLPGCGCLGGQTGQCGKSAEDTSASPPECRPDRPLEFAQRSPLGYSALDVIDALGGEFVATAPGGELPFWEALALEEPAPQAVDLELIIEYFDGAVIERDCDHRLDIEVVVTLRADSVGIHRSAVATLGGNPQLASLQTEILPPVTGDASSVPITVVATITPTQAEGELIATTSDPLPWLAFVASRP